jgi:hypothetical protein
MTEILTRQTGVLTALLSAAWYQVMLSCPLSLFLRRGGQNTRHSRAGLESRKGAEYWIPACAEMTGWGNASGHPIILPKDYVKFKVTA